jgi:uncharacterized membrane protein
MTDTTPSAPGKSSTGLDGNVAAAMSYVAGFITGIGFLLLEQENRFVRFHALQSTVTFLAIAALHLAVNVVPILGALLSLFVIFPATVVLWLVLIVKAYRGERFKLPVVGDFVEQQLR